MNPELLNEFETKGLPNAFAVTKTGEVFTTSGGESLKSQFLQLGTLIFETIGAVGDIKIDTIEIIGETQGLIFNVLEETLVGSLFTSTEGLSIAKLQALLNELAQGTRAAQLPEEKPRIKINLEVFDDIKAIMKEYLGDFTDRIYQNQLKAQRIKLDEVYDEDARRFMFALGKAAGMIIGPSKGRELTNKLLGLIK